MEMWDIYDACMNKTGRTVGRGMPKEEGELNIVVHIYPVNHKGEILIQKRTETKDKYPGMWAFTGGAVVEGETPWEGCQRELMEELGIEATTDNTELVGILNRKDNFCSIWLVKTDIDIEELRLQEEEVTEAKWATVEEIKEIIKTGNFVFYHYIDWMFDYIKDSVERDIKK